MSLAFLNLPAHVRRWGNRLVRPPTLDRSTTTRLSSIPTFPLATYLSTHLLLSALLLFSFAFLPRSDAFWRAPIADAGSENGAGHPRQTVSADRPEHPFLTPITSDPFKSLVFQVLGVAVCMLWWSHHLRGWWRSEKLRGRLIQQNKDKDEMFVVQKETFAERLQVSFQPPFKRHGSLIHQWLLLF